MDRYDWQALFMAGLFILSILLIAHMCFEPRVKYTAVAVKAPETALKQPAELEPVEDLLSLMESVER